MMAGERLPYIDQATQDTQGGKQTEHLSRGSARFGQTSTKLLRVVEEFQTAHPLGSISLSEIGTHLGVTRERVRQLYEQLSKTHTLPPKNNSRMEQLNQEYLGRLDQEVAGWINQGMKPQQIAKELHVPLLWVANSQTQKRLALENKEREKRNQEEFQRQVEALRKEGIGTKEIASKLGKPKQVEYLVRKLVRAGRVQKMRQRKSPQELVPFDEKVKELRAAELTYREIAERLGPGVTDTHILASVQRLHRKGEIELKPSQQQRI